MPSPNHFTPPGMDEWVDVDKYPSIQVHYSLLLIKTDIHIKL
jgi:hypothetical protein